MTFSLRRSLCLLMTGFALCCISYAQAQDVVVLDFDAAMERVLNNSLQLKISKSDIYVKAGERQQVGLYPNPVISYEVENFASKNFRASADRVSRYEVEQFVELGSKRRIRKTLASQKYDKALVDHEVNQIEILNRASKAFIAVAAAQEQLFLAKEQAKVSNEALNALGEKVRNGKIPLIHQNKAEIDCASSEFELENACIRLQAAKERLSLFWGCQCPDFDEVAFSFYDISCPLSLTECLEDFCTHPEIARAHLDYLAAHLTVELEKADRTPDLSLMLGYKSGQDKGDSSMVFGVAVPIPIFDRNQGNISRAYAEECRSQEETKLVWLLLELKLSIAHKELLQAYCEAEKLREKVLRIANKSYESVHEGYKAGKYEYLDVLQSQRTLCEIKDKYIQVLVNYHNRRADIEYLTIDVD